MLALSIMRDILCHVDAEDLERYSMGTSPPEATPLIEEHLLTCDGCRNRLRETDVYVRAMATSSEQIRREEKAAKRREWRIPAWFPVMVTVACGIVLVVATPRFTRSPGPAVAVSLTALRSGSAGNSAPPGRELMLHPDLTGLAENSSYRLEIVNQTGHTVRQGKLTRAQNGIQVRGLGAGLYFVRVYLPAGELLREYGLRIQ
jgi:hypothetical protein